VALELAELMPVDSSEIRAILNRDPFWCLYALGDLDPHEYSLCDWRVKVGMQPAVVLLYQRFSVPVLFAVGQPADVEAVLHSRSLPPKVYLHVRPGYHFNRSRRLRSGGDLPDGTHDFSGQD
jgi:hypothetical protein